MKKFLVSILLGLSLSISGQMLVTNSTFADPCIKLDYGQSYYWLVDKGTLSTYGKISQPCLCIRAYRETPYCSEGYRNYRFTQVNGVWKFCYDGYTGKTQYIPAGNWEPVAGNQLANDILYIATN
ncbi:MAG: hypothetical protein PUI26_11100 [Selenomonadaceae bacterium]|nr:hypothetical protein [Selenomonadaceae bacterium]